MSEQSLELQSSIQKNEVTQGDVDTLLSELSELEKSHLWWDGILWSGETETLADKKYKEIINKEDSVIKKKDLIENLIKEIQSNFKNTWKEINDRKKQEFMTEKAKKEVNQLEKNYSELTNKYPEYKDWIDTFIKMNFEQHDYIKDFYKKNDINNYSTIISSFYEWSFNFLNSEIKTIEKYIIDIEKSDSINIKWIFFKSFIEKVYPWLWVNSEWIGNKIDEISTLEIYNDSQKNKKWSSSYVLGGLDLLRLPINEIKKINQLYINTKNNPTEENKLINYVNNNLHPYKHIIFENLEVYWEIFKRNEKERLWIKDYSWLSYVIKDISKLSNSANKKTMEKFFVDICNFWKDNKWKDNYIKKFIYTNSSFIFDDTTKDANLKYEIIYDVFYDTTSNLTKKEDMIDLTTLDAFENRFKNKVKNDVSLFLKENSKTKEWAEISKLFEEYEKTSDDDTKRIKREEIYERIWWNNMRSQMQRPQEQEKESPKESLLNWKNWKNIKELIQTPWIKLNEKWELEIKEPVKIGNNGTIELWENGELVYMSSLGYEFKFEKNLNISADSFFEIKNQIEFYDTIWFWFFWENFKQMMDILKANQSIIWGLGISINEWVGSKNNFLNPAESIKVCEIFSKIWFLEWNVSPNNLTNEKITKTQFTQKIINLSNTYWENNFFYNDNFNWKWFLEVIKQVYNKKEA